MQFFGLVASQWGLFHPPENTFLKKVLQKCCKNSEDLGKEGVDILYNIIMEKGILDNVIFGTFHKEVSAYVDENYPDLARSTSIPEVFEFWQAALSLLFVIYLMFNQVCWL